MNKKERVVEVYHYEPKIKKKEKEDPGIRRVAAYCRVSTLNEEQELSFKTQCEYYEKLISASPGMVLAGIYGDHGISGVVKDTRPEFLRMIKDCEDGKIDVVMTKSVSRFSRNMSDCVETIELLKSLGISVIFEKEGIDSSDPNSELFLNILSSLAQEESNSLSMNLRWAHEKRILDGKPSRATCYGYRKVGKLNGKMDHTWVIYEPEAKKVRMAFNMALEGHQYSEIVDALVALEEEEGGDRKWYQQQVYHMFINEAYKGDLLTHKHYKPDYKSKKIILNRGEREQYYIEDHHEAIIPREDFDKVQEMIKTRKMIRKRTK